MGRSIRREARMARSEGRPSRRMKLPGMRPTAYSFSSKSTDRGKKSMPSRGFLEAVALTSTQVSPQRTMQEALDRPASLPVSTTRGRPARVVSNLLSLGNSILVIIKRFLLFRCGYPMLLALEWPGLAMRPGHSTAKKTGGTAGDCDILDERKCTEGRTKICPPFCIFLYLRRPSFLTMAR